MTTTPHDPAVLVLIGTKAQFIKTAPVLLEMDALGLPYRLVYTGQHSETFDLLEAAFGTRKPDEVLVPDFEAATHGRFLTWILRYWKAVFSRVRSGAWKGTRIGLVHGDTVSTLFGAMTVRLVGGMVGHIEAGLRSPRLLEPFPEEIVRRLVSRLSRMHFVPDEPAAHNLAKTKGTLVRTEGNTLMDALRMSLSKARAAGDVCGKGGYGVVSMHRSENLASRATLDRLLDAFIDAAQTVPLRFVLHPVTREKLASNGWLARLQQVPNLTLQERMDYPDFVRLLLDAKFLMTDGGSNQEEAAMMGLPTLLLRRATERPDGIGGVVELSDLDPARIREFVVRRSSQEWRLSTLGDTSPSRVLVNALMLSLA